MRYGDASSPVCVCVCVQALLSERSCSSQLAQLSRSLQQKEEELRQVQDQHSSSYSDLEKIRELCVKLDASKESVSLAGNAGRWVGSEIGRASGRERV